MRNKFVQELLDADADFSTKYWTHMKQTTIKDIDSNDYEWMSWKQFWVKKMMKPSCS